MKTVRILGAALMGFTLGILPLKAQSPHFVVKILVYDSTNNLNDSSRAGSGFYVRRDGRDFILTNAHVVRDRNFFAVYFNDGTMRPFRAQLRSFDALMDVALLELAKEDEGFFPEPAELGNSDSLKPCIYDSVLHVLRPADRVTIVFSDLGFTPIQFSGSEGVVSNARMLSIGSQPRLISVTAPMLPGGSGSPLLDNAGRVVGMNEGTLTFGHSWTPFSFSIPINDILKILPALEAGDTMSVHEVVHGGVAGLRVSPCVYQAPFCLPGSVYVVGLTPQLEAAGLAKGDILRAVNGKPVKDLADFLLFTMLDRSPGEKVNLTIWRKHPSPPLRYDELTIAFVLQAASIQRQPQQ